MPRPLANEAAPYYFTYIDQAPADDILPFLEAQTAEIENLLASLSEERSLYRYAGDKWSIRELWNHVTDTERAFTFRALWFARGFTEPLPGFDQDVAAAGIHSDAYSWQSHIADFRAVRQATLTLFRGIEPEVWLRRGTASGCEFTVQAMAYITAGHVAHHARLLRERYLTT